MNGSHPLAEATVLRGIVVSGEPRGISLGGGVSKTVNGSMDPAGSDRTLNLTRGSAPRASESGAQGRPVDALTPESGYQDGFDRGWTDGHQKGLAAGRREGMEQGLREGREMAAREGLLQAEAAQEAMAERVERIDAWFAALSEEWNRQMAIRLAAVEEDMVALSTAVALRFLGDHLITRETIAHGVRQAVLQHVGPHAAGQALSIHVHPRDLEQLRMDSELSAWLEARETLTTAWVPDPSVGLGGCVIRTAQGSLDARLDTQFSALRDRLSQLRAEGGQGQPVSTSMRGHQSSVSREAE